MFCNAVIIYTLTLPFELIDLPTGKARFVKARTLRFRAVNAQERWGAELCSREIFYHLHSLRLV